MDNTLDIDFTSESNELLLNPRLPGQARKQAERQLGMADVPSSHVWLSTSGSTGSPKLAGISKKALLLSASAVNDHLKVASTDVWGLSLPLFHVGGIGILARALVGGTKVVRIDSKWDPQAFCDAVIADGITLTSLVPTQLFDLVAKGLTAPKSLRAIVVGGGALTPELYTQSRSLGWPALPSFGMTETCSQIATASLRSLSKEADAYPPLEVLPCFDVSTTPEGKLQVSRGPMFSGYVLEEHGLVRFVDPKIGGTFTSEDLVEIYGPASNLIRHLGRTADRVKVKGENVALGILETTVRSLLGPILTFQDCAIVSAPHPRDGNALVLFIETSAPAEVDRSVIASLLGAKLLPFEVPSEIVSLPKFPRSALGKIQRTSLLEMSDKRDR